MAVGHYIELTDPGLHGTELNGDFISQTKKDFLLNDTGVVSSHVASFFFE